MGSSMAQGDEMAVWGRGLLKGYGKKEPEVLKHLNITVPRGSIYGLLGPSGCGKTTLLRCIVGRLSVDAGHLLVLGDRPGNPHHGVPGSMIGYMPQEMALFNKMTIGETLRYFGRVHGMGAGAIQDRTRFLLDFLSLPNEGRLVQSLSGGQKRRVSFSVALLHEPELLILDEPTVGVDPLLRERIWEHLISIAGTYGKEGTIIITTHYIEEARQATLVGLMRAGRLLAEESPTALLEKYKINSLETVFLQLCYEDSKQESQADSELTVTGTGVAVVTGTGRAVVTQTGAVMETTPLLGSASRTPVLSNSGINSNYGDILTKTTGSRCRCSLSCPSAGNILAQFLKNLTLMKRNIGFLLFQFILPSIQIILFCVCIGRDPYDLHVALVNRDTPPMFYPPLGNMFIEHLDNYTVHKVAYTDLEAALQSVKHGDTWGVIYMGHNFTYDTVQRFTNMSHMTNDTVDGSTIKLYLDMTNQQISLVIQQKVLDAFEKLAESLLGSTGATLPIKVQEAVYGDLTPSFTNFMAPGVILSITFFMATGLTTLSFVIERKEGLLDRSLVSGMTSFEIMLAHVCTQLLVMAVQVLLLLVFALFVFHVPYKGPLIWVVILVLLQGLCGMTLGVIISVLCEEETSAIQLALGSVYPMLLMSGIIWPVEAIPEWMRYVSICLPMTYAGEAMRAILSKGWDVLHLQVWRGYLTTMAWSFGLLALAGLILRIKR